MPLGSFGSLGKTDNVTVNGVLVGWADFTITSPIGTSWVPYFRSIFGNVVSFNMQESISRSPIYGKGRHPHAYEHGPYRCMGQVTMLAEGYYSLTTLVGLVMGPIATQRVAVEQGADPVGLPTLPYGATIEDFPSFPLTISWGRAAGDLGMSSDGVSMTPVTDLRITVLPEFKFFGNAVSTKAGDGTILYQLDWECSGRPQHLTVPLFPGA